MKELPRTNSNDDRAETAKPIKCLVWDLDGTLWHGVLLENDALSLRENVAHIVKTLDSRGILQSIASRNDYEMAMDKVAEFGLSEYFLFPQINWNSKVSSIKAIIKALNIGADAVAFIDDQPFEREEVGFSLPGVACIDSADLGSLLELPGLNPRIITEDSRMRRLMYLSDQERRKAEESFCGSPEAFLATLHMVFTISAATEEDLQRAEELTIRTNQLNTTGYTYSYDELNYFRQSKDHRLLVMSLRDKFGSYGKIGLTLIECARGVWIIKLLLISCRVASRGLGTVLLNHIMAQALKAQARLRAEFVANDRNRLMYITYKFTGFKEIERSGQRIILENDPILPQPFPSHLQVDVQD
jgi:FkbH-like protein